MTVFIKNGSEENSYNRIRGDQDHDVIVSMFKKNGYIKAYDMCKELKKLQEEYLFLKEVDNCGLKINFASKAIALIVLEVLIKELIIVILPYSKRIAK